MLVVIISLILISGALSLLITYFARRVGLRLGAFDTPGASGHIKTEIHQIPNTGGIAIYLGITLPMIAGLVAVGLFPDRLPFSFADSLTVHLPGMRQRGGMIIALIACLTVLHIMGVIDDRRPLGAAVKLLIQIIVAAVMVIGFDSRLLTLLDNVVVHPYGWLLSSLLTIAWFIVVTNAINFMDNMDGLAGGVAVIAGIIFLIAAILNQQWFIAMTLALLIGSATGFLVFNRPPASIFMGDGGSLVLGFLLAFLTVRTTYFGDPDIDGIALGNNWYAVFMPLIILAVPLYDFTGVVLLRLSQGKNPMRGDEQHFSHRLVRLGMTKRSAVLIIYACTLATGIGGISLGKMPGWQAVLVFIQAACILGVLAAIEFATGSVSGNRNTSNHCCNEKPAGDKQP